MFKSLLALILLAPPLFGETLLSGAMYFDSENTLLEVQNLLKAGNTDGLSALFKNNHISEKVNKNLPVILLFSDTDRVEFRFADNPTTYWTYPKYVAVNAPKAEATPQPTPSLSPGPNSNLPADFPSSITSSSMHIPVAMPTPSPSPKPTPTPTPAPVVAPTPTPKVRVASRTEEKEEDTETPRPPRRRHYRARETAKEDEDVPEWAKVWHTVNGRRKWYDKRNYHEVRKALPVSSAPIAAVPASAPVPVAPAPNVPTGTAIPNPTPPPRALPARPSSQ
jgi:hypothetical protein